MYGSKQGPKSKYNPKVIIDFKQNCNKNTKIHNLQILYIVLLNKKILLYIFLGAEL